MLDVATLQLKAGLILITNSCQVCFPSDLITTHLFNDCMGFESVSRKHLNFYWFQGHKLLRNDQNIKRSEDFKKREDQTSRGSLFYFLSIKTYVTFCSCYSCFSRYYTKKGAQDKVNDSLVVLNNMT